MRAKLEMLQQQFPKVVKLENADEKLGVPYMVNCEAGKKCILDIVTLTDFETSADEKVQVYISGALHGNERLGPVVSYYLLEFLASSYDKDPFVTELLKTREIVVTPMTNTIGYYEN